MSILLALAYFAVVIKPEVEAIGAGWAQATREPAEPPPPSHAPVLDLERTAAFDFRCDLPRRQVLEQLARCFEAGWTAKFAEVDMRFTKPSSIQLIWDPKRATCDYDTEWSGIYCSETGIINVLISEDAVWNMFVLAHEYAHHVQAVGFPVRGGWEGDEYSRRLELQADCLGAAMLRKVIGRQLDRLRRMLLDADAEHGTAASQSLWMKRGLKYGTVIACDTWTAPAAEVS